MEIDTMSLVGRFVGAHDADSASDSVLAGLLLGTSYPLIISLISLLATPALIVVFLESNFSSAIQNLVIWGTQLNAFMMFSLHSWQLAHHASPAENSSLLEPCWQCFAGQQE